MKKVLGVLSLLGLFTLSQQEVKASNEEYEVREVAVGRQKLNYEDINCFINSSGYVEMEMTCFYKIPANTVYCLYSSYEGCGLYSGGEQMRVIFRDTIESKDEEVIVGTSSGGWAMHTYIENNTNEERLFRIGSFDFYDSLLRDCNTEGHFMLQEEKDTNTMTFQGYYDYINPEYNLTSETDLTYITDNHEMITDSEILSYVKAYDNQKNGECSLSVISNTYSTEKNNYSMTIRATDQAGLYSEYTVNVLAINRVIPTVKGANEVTLKMSELSSYSINKFLSQYTATYGTRVGTCTLSEDDKIQFMKALSSNEKITITVLGKFEGIRDATKTVTFQVVDDVAPDIYISQYILKTTVINEMTDDKLTDYLEEQIKGKFNVEVENLTIKENGYKGFENQEGTYLVDFTYEVDGTEYKSSLAIKVEKETKEKKSNKAYVYAGASIAAIGLVGLLIRKRKKNTLKKNN